jgi:hypothetical protein
MSFTPISGGTPVRRPAPARIAVPAANPLLAPGARAPSYPLARPAGVASSAQWAGPSRPAGGVDLGWRGVGGGWWQPTVPGGGGFGRRGPILTPAPGRPVGPRPLQRGPAMSGSAATQLALALALAGRR